jgi:hypothetical protein
MQFAFDLRFDKERTWAGDWWTPDNPTHRVPGRLTYSPETGINIECYAQLLANFGGRAQTVPILHGEIDHGDSATLFHASGSYVGSGKTQWISASSMILGTHVESFEAPFSEVKVVLDNLNDWASEGSFNGDATEIANSSGGLRYAYDVQMSPMPSFQIPSLNANFALGKTVGCTGFGHTVTLSEEHNLTLGFQEVVPMRMALEYAERLELFLTLVVGWPSLIKSMSLISSTEPGNRKTVNLLFNRSWKTTATKTFNRTYMPAPLEKIIGQLGEIVGRWFTVTETYAPIIKLLRSSLFLPESAFLEDRFLTIAQAIEGYCRIDKDETFLTDDEFEPIRHAVLEQIPTTSSQRFGELVSGRVSNFNQYGLKDRLVSLFKRNDWLRFVIASLNNPTPNDDAINDFAGKVVKTRNRLTHVESGPSRSRMTDYDTFWQLRAVLCALFLNDAGVPIDEAIRDKHGIHYRLWWR